MKLGPIHSEHVKIDWGTITECGCMGPRRGQPLCPCSMNYVTIEEGRFIVKVDLGPVPTDLLKTLNSSMFDTISSTRLRSQ